MSYYLLPSKNTFIELDFIFEESDCTNVCYISPSLEYYNTLMNNQIKETLEEKEIIETGYAFDFFQKTVNPYEYIFTKVPGTKFSVGKMKPFSGIFYTFLEMIHILNLFDAFNHRKIRTAISGSNGSAMNECIDILRENYIDIHLELESISESHSVDFFYFEVENESLNSPIKTMLKFIANILQFQSANGVSVIKISSFSEKPVLELIYILTSLYEKIYIIKPNASNLFSCEKFIVCKNYKFSLEIVQYYLREINSVLPNILENKTIISIAQKSLPYYFLNKVEEANVIIGHQQLDIMEQLINLIKNKNREDKIESLKKHNIQKCIQWCEKYKIPYNKFAEKVNIFLSASSADDLAAKNEDFMENNNAVLNV